MCSIEHNVKPILKWAGGKTQLLKEIREKYPKNLGVDIIKYAEPFIGGGAVLFDILVNYKLDEVYISDVNVELINTYKVVRDSVEELIKMLRKMQSEYLVLDDENRRTYYSEKRDRFNKIKFDDELSLNIEKASLFLYLNKTCFNGLYRVNKSGKFNVPIGSYKNPLICNEDNLREVSCLLSSVKIVCGDYKKCETFVDANTFVYIDPPYRPLNETSSFNSYSENVFDDDAQIQLAEFVKLLNKKGAKLVVSNSDPKNIDVNDCFFDKLYEGFNINRVSAKRMINSKATSRGKITELLIDNNCS